MIFSVFAGDVQEGDWSGELGKTPCWEPMPQEPPIGVCNPDVISEKYFAICEGVSLTVPGIIDDKFLRRLIVNGYSLENAYKALGYPYWQGLIPEEKGLHACIRDALKTERRDPTTGKMVPMYPGNATCIDFWGCFADFINAKRKTSKAGRIELGDNAFVPSLPEQECIRINWLDTGNVTAAYEACGASDIIPWWEGGLSGLNDALRTKININIYDVLKASYTFATVEIIVPTPTTQRITRMDMKLRREYLERMAKWREEREKTSPWVYGIIAFGIGALIMRK